MRYVDRVWSLRYTILLLVVLQVFDTLSTMLALGAGFQEGNPILARLLADGGATSLVAVKWAVVGLVFLAVALDPLQTPYVRAALVIMNVVYALVVTNNFAAYGMARGSMALAVAFAALALSWAIVAVDEAFFSHGAGGGEQAGAS